MNKTILLISLALSFSSLCYSQFREGFIITNDNKTTYGYINFEGSIINSDRCEFRSQPDDETQIFKPGEIKAYRFNNSKFFSSMEIPVNNVPKTVFIEWLIKGRVSILTYSASVSEVIYFLLLEDGSLIELTNTLQTVRSDGMIYEHKRQEYKGTLNYYLRDCPTLKPKIEALLLNSKPLINLAKEYHAITCDSLDCIIYEDKDRKLKYTIGVSGSFLSSHLTLNSGKPEVVYNSNNLGYGIAFKAENLPVVSPKFSAKLYLMLYSSLFRYDTTVIWSHFPELLHAKIAGEDRMFEVKYIRMPIQVTYKFSQKKINPFISLGIIINFRYSYTKYSQYLIDYALDNQGYTLGSTALLTQFGLNSGAGLEFLATPKFSLSLGYDFEYFYRFFGGTVNDYTRLINNHVYVSTYFKFR